MKKIIIAFAVASLGVSSVALAIDPINARQVDQMRRIDAGKRSGKLSRGERDALTSQQRSIARQEDAMRGRHGGHLTMHDKRVLHARQHHANRAISAAKHNHRRGRHGIHIG